MNQKSFLRVFLFVIIVFGATIVGALYVKGIKPGVSTSVPAETPSPKTITFSLTKDIKNWKSFEDPNKQFSFFYPNTFPTITQTEPSRGSYVEFPTFVSDLMGGQSNAEVRIEVKGPYLNSANTQIVNFLEGKNLFLPKEGISQSESGEIERMSALIDSKSAIVIKEKSAGSVSYLIYFQTNLGIYSINLFSSDGNQSNADDFTNMLASLKFLNPLKDQLLPLGWYWTPSAKCGVQFPTPNGEAPIKGLTENEITRIYQWNATFSLTKNNYLVSVEVLCSPNVKKFTTDTIVGRIEEIVAGNTQSQNRTIPSKILSKVKTNKWGRIVYVLTYDAGDFQDFYKGDNYVFATDSYTYSVRVVDNLSDRQTSDEIRQIFDNLKFK